MSSSRGQFFETSFALLLAGGTLALALTLRTAIREQRPQLNIDRPPLYLPAADKVRLATLGFNDFASDLLWFSTLSYFGDELYRHGDYSWLAHRCDLVTQLNPRSIDRYDFCASLLAWMAKDPQSSTSLLSRAIDQFPSDWHLRYSRAFNYWYFLNDPGSATADLKRALTLPDAPPQLAGLTARLLNSTSDPQVAVDFLADSLQRTKDKDARRALEERLKQARLTRDLTFLTQAASSFKTNTGRLPASFDEIISAGMLKGVPAEPFGGKYEIDSVSGEVHSTSGQKGLSFSAETPMAHKLKGEKGG